MQQFQQKLIKTNKDSVIHKLMHYNAKYEFLDTTFNEENILLNLMSMTLFLFCITHSIQNDQTESITN